jgi:hypothetical protein
VEGKGKPKLMDCRTKMLMVSSKGTDLVIVKGIVTMRDSRMNSEKDSGTVTRCYLEKSTETETDSEKVTPKKMDSTMESSKDFDLEK